jgi:ABC-type multidrug transport system fused ATPase/permease subunit
VVSAGAWWLALGTLQVGAFYFFITAVSMFMWPLRQMGRILTDLGKAFVSLDRIGEILREPPESSADPAAAPTPAARPRSPQPHPPRSRSPRTPAATTTLAELTAAAGAHPYLALFDNPKKMRLYYGRRRRTASPAQRLALYALDRGCAKPGCTTSAHHSQVHHATRDWQHGGATDKHLATLLPWLQEQAP